MRKRHAFVGLSACLILLGCATPDQRCLDEATRDLRTVNQLIAETEGNLQRGFAYETQIRSSQGINFCAGYYNNIGTSFCTGNRIVETQRPIAINEAAERQKLSDLKARRADIQRDAELATAACRAA